MDSYSDPRRQRIAQEFLRREAERAKRGVARGRYSEWEKAQLGRTPLAERIRPKALQTGRLGEKRSLAPKWRKVYRAAKAAKRKGFKKAAEELGLEAFKLKAATPGIISQEYREAEAQRQDALSAAQARREKMIDAYLDMYDRRGGMGGGPYSTSVDPYYNRYPESSGILGGVTGGGVPFADNRRGRAGAYVNPM